MLEHKTVVAEYNVGGAPGSFSGLGAVFDNEDLGGDIIVRGAFDDTLTDLQSKGRTLPILWQHDSGEPLGPWDKVTITDKGLKADGRLLIESDPLALRAHGLMKSKAVSGLSIGYRIPQGGMEYDGEVRHLKRIDLHEISIVTFPMNDEARIDAVKAAELTHRQMERILTQDAKLSRSVARALMADGYKAIQPMQDAGEDVSEIKRLLEDRVSIATTQRES